MTIAVLILLTLLSLAWIVDASDEHAKRRKR